jgi:hypothetical protein
MQQRFVNTGFARWALAAVVWIGLGTTAWADNIKLDKVAYIDGAYNENLGATSTIKNVLNASDHSGATAGTVTRSLLGMPSITVPGGMEIASITLNLWCTSYNKNGAATNFSMALYPLTQSWVEGTGITGGGSLSGATWNTYNGTDLWTTAGGGGDYDSSVSVMAASTPSKNHWTTFDLTSIWSNANLQTYGALLTITPEDGTLVPSGYWITESFATDDWVNDPGADYNPYVSVTFVAVPEPVTWFMLLSGCIMATLFIRRRKF